MTIDLLLQAYSFHHASDLPEKVWGALSQIEPSANIVLPFLKKALTSARSDDGEQLWITLFDDTDKVAFVLSCTKGPLGSYPIFVVTCEAGRGMDLADAMSALVRRLLEEAPPHRVFSVFSTENVATAFARAFEAHVPAEHGIRAHEAPYYVATFSFCTSGTFVESLDLTFRPKEGEVIDISLQRADMTHLEDIKRLCEGFYTWPYFLDGKGAELEAMTMIKNNQVWVHVARRAGQEPEIACLIATTRESQNVTAVTKVFTAPEWRKRGCAKRLLHRVCQDILRDQKKERVVLYVGIDLAPAREVYRQIGFQGLDNPEMNKWLEVGFEHTTLGYW